MLRMSLTTYGRGEMPNGELYTFDKKLTCTSWFNIRPVTRYETSNPFGTVDGKSSVAREWYHVLNVVNSFNWV